MGAEMLKSLREKQGEKLALAPGAPSKWHSISASPKHTPAAAVLVPGEDGPWGEGKPRNRAQRLQVRGEDNDP